MNSLNFQRETAEFKYDSTGQQEEYEKEKDEEKE